MFKKLKYHFENAIYDWRYGKQIDLREFKIKSNSFSKRHLNIIYLTHFDGPFSINNTLKPLEELGMVFKFELDPKMDRKNWYAIKDKRNQDMLHFVQECAKNHKIDVIVCYLSGFSTTPKILQEIKKLQIPMINESLDDERKFVSKKGKDGLNRGMKDICRYFDLSLTTSKSAIKKYLVENSQVMYKEYAGNEQIYKKMQLPKKYDVVFIGAKYGVREKYVQYLIENGIDVYCKGDGWGNGFASDEEMILLFNEAKIILGFATVGKNDDIFILKGRDFEAPLTGSFYITGNHEELNEYFEVGRDIETYLSKEDLLQKVQYYLQHEKEREEIAQNGYEKCIYNYTAKVAYEKVFGYLGL